MDVRDFSMDYFSLVGKNAVVTGGNTGLGQAFSVGLAKAGANVFVAGMDRDDGETERLIEAEGCRMEFLAADITVDGVPREVINGCVDTFGAVDILVNSAGVCHIAAVDGFGRDEWDSMVAVNLTAPFELARHAAKFMTAQRSGKIINIASLFSVLGGQLSPAYAATKHGIAGFTKAYCDELARHNVQVNSLAPGYFATSMTQATRSDPQAGGRVLDHIPAGRWGTTDDLMGAMVFLASKASDYVNGHMLVVDGGYLVR